MKDIENIDADSIKINNPYSNNSFWKNANKTEDIDLDDFEYQKQIKENEKKKEILNNILDVMNFNSQKIGLIILSILVFIMYILALVCANISLHDGNFKIANDLTICSCVFGGLFMYTLIELEIKTRKMPFRKFKFYKDMLKSIKENKKEIFKFASTIEKPKKPKIPTLEDWLKDE